MKHFLFLSFTVMIFSSCCLVSSRDCGCRPPKPFLVESTKEWLLPFYSAAIPFETSGTPILEQAVSREYQEGVECGGGVECCSNFPIHTAEFSVDHRGQKQALLRTKAIQNIVEFSAGKQTYIHIASLNIYNGSFSTPDYINLIESDTLINGVPSKKIRFQNTDSTKDELLFNDLEFIRGVGVVGYTDTTGKTWRQK